MRIPSMFETRLWQWGWLRNPLTMGVIACLPYGKVDRPIFIVGSPRSGTSVFSRLFCQHPELANWSEGHCLFDPSYLNRSNEHRWTEDMLGSFMRRRLRSNVYWYTKFVSMRQGINANRFTNKLPRNTLRIPYLLKAYPDAQFIHIIRDGRAVVRSMVRVIDRQNKHDRVLGAFARPEGWQEYHESERYEAHSRQWVGIEETVQKDLATIPDDRIYRTRYESFIKDTRQTMQDICTQFGLRADDDAIQGWPEHLENRNEKWPRECSADEIETMRTWLTPMLIEYGYETQENWPIPSSADAPVADDPVSVENT